MHCVFVLLFVNIVLLVGYIICLPFVSIFSLDFESKSEIEVARTLASWVDSILGTDFLQSINRIYKWIPKDDYGDDVESAIKGTFVELAFGGVETTAEVINGIAHLYNVTPELVEQALREADPENLYLSLIKGIDAVPGAAKIVVENTPALTAWFVVYSGESVANFVVNGEGLADYINATTDLFFEAEEFVKDTLTDVPVVGKPIVEVYESVVEPPVEFVAESAHSIAKVAETIHEAVVAPVVDTVKNAAVDVFEAISFW